MNKREHFGLLRRMTGGVAGFTLSEVMVASALGAILLVGIMTTYLFSIKSFLAVNNYAQIHSDGRSAIDQFARDMRSVNSVVSFATNGPLVVTIPTNFVGATPLTKTATYTYSGSALYRSDSSTGKTSLLATNVYYVCFSLYDKYGNNTNVTSCARSVQVDIKLRKSVANLPQTEDYLSARLDMRNTP